MKSLRFVAARRGLTVPCRAAQRRAQSSLSASPRAEDPAPETPGQQVLTLRELDRLVTIIAENAAHSRTPATSPLVMRTLTNPWLTQSSPDLHGQSDHSSPTPTYESASSSTSSATESERAAAEAAEAARLAPRHMSESYTEFSLPLASDPALFQMYVNASGGFRMGKLLEHLDSLAGAVAYRHCLPPPTPGEGKLTPAAAFQAASSRAGLYLATASADRLDMYGRLSRDHPRDLKFSGFVTWTGSSSMEVAVKMEGERDGGDGWETLMLGQFAMVCRDSKTHKSKKVPKLVVESEEEKALWRMGEDHKRRKRESEGMALDKVPPTSEEAGELHKLMLDVESGVQELNGEQVVRINDTQVESVQLMFPQDRNLHGKVFGGILMRLAFELCFTNAAIFASTPMRFLSLDQITFRLPVPIGAVLRLSSKVVHTTQPHAGPDGEAKVHVMVRAEVEEVETGVRRETNTFFFTLAKEDRNPIGRTVVPWTYVEAMDYLEGKRRLEMGDEMRQLYQVGSGP